MKFYTIIFAALSLIFGLSSFADNGGEFVGEFNCTNHEVREFTAKLNADCNEGSSLEGLSGENVADPASAPAMLPEGQLRQGMILVDIPGVGKVVQVQGANAQKGPRSNDGLEPIDNSKFQNIPMMYGHPGNFLNVTIPLHN